MNSFKFENVSFDYTFEADTQGGKLAYSYEAEQTSPHTLHARLKFKNTSKEDVFIENLYPIVISNLKISDISSKEWMILNNGRHKNDIPSVCCAGRRDGAFFDAAGKLSEAGSFLESDYDGDAVLTGDQICAIKAGENAVSFYFESAEKMLTEILIPIDREGRVGKIKLGGFFGCLIKSGETLYSEWCAVDASSSVFAVIEDYAKKRARVKGKYVPSDKPCVYSTWSYYGEDVCFDDVATNVKKIKELSLPFTVFQIDDGWEKCYGDWICNEKFACGPERTAKLITDANLTAGIWTAPLICDTESELSHSHPDWLLKHKDGSKCLFHMVNKDYFVLDCTNPEVIKWIEDLYRRLSSLGFKYHKLDFTRAFFIQTDCDYFNNYLTPTESYIEAMKAVRRGMGDDGYFLICGGMYDALIGIVDAARTGSDVKSMWLDVNGENPKIPFTVKQNTIRYFMNYWWHNDPDSLMVRKLEHDDTRRQLKRGTLTDDEAITFTANQYFGGGLIGSTEPLDIISPDRLYLLRHIMPTVDTNVRPMDMFSGERFISKIDVFVKKGWHTVCLVNWGDSEIPISLSLDDSLCGGEKTYVCASFFGKEIRKGAKKGDTVSFGYLSPHATEIIKIAPENTPQIVESDAHFSFGGEVGLEESGNSLTVSVNNLYPVSANYAVMTAGGKIIRFTAEKGEFKKTFKI